MPGDIYERAGRELPVIIAMWHGQHFMAPFIKKKGHKAKTLISRHRDGEMNAVAAEWLGVETIRGSGDHGDGFYRKGGVSAYFQMLEALAEGYNVALTADVPKDIARGGVGDHPARSRFRPRDLSGRTGLEPAQGARQLGSQHHQSCRSAGSQAWSATPFGSAADASDADLEAARIALETALNSATDRAYAIADGKSSEPRG